MTDNLQPSQELHRECRKCGSTKALDEFAIVYAKNSRGMNYRQHTCKDCAKVEHSARMRKARRTAPEKYRGHQRQHRQRHLTKVRRQATESKNRRKTRVMRAYGGEFCVCCGETAFSMLTIDHIMGDGAKHRDAIRRERGLSQNRSVDLYTRLEAEGFPPGFQVLCYNCNISKHRCGTCEHKLLEGSTTIPKGSSLEAIAKRNVGRPLKGR